jgi:hypothetical protein
MPAEQMQIPNRIELLSKELVVARVIYAAEFENDPEPMFFNRLVSILESKHLASRATVSKSLDMLFDQGILKADWQKRPDGKYVRGLEIAGEAKKFIEAIYKHTSMD